MEKLGEAAAFGTALLWTASALFFEGSSRRVGALAVNFWKVVLAFALLCLAGLATRGLPLPLDASASSWAYLSLSGLVGFVIADHFGFTAYILIGSRVTVVFQALTPLFAAAFGLLILGEKMGASSLLGMAAVVLGILVLVLGRRDSAAAEGAGRTGGGAGAAKARPGAKGYVFALLSALFTALGLVTSKLGLEGIEAIPATQIRVLVAILGFGAQALFLRRGRAVFVSALRDGRAMRGVAAGAVVGPFLGVVLSLYALQHTDAGTASTLMSLTPVLIIPPAILFFRQKVGLLEALGAAIAVGGTALFFLA